ncbi:unnamed protein product [Brugia pahangi]|uniref:Uncharacterized protein n=1 Tax=Brugia pahangi TaxID=6280 RepID=A0A0N4T1E2_BRUPA|nr:unnamed protein product [Brugia pahangi]
MVNRETLLIANGGTSSSGELRKEKERNLWRRDSAQTIYHPPFSTSTPLPCSASVLHTFLKRRR